MCIRDRYIWWSRIRTSIRRNRIRIWMFRRRRSINTRTIQIESDRLHIRKHKEPRNNSGIMEKRDIRSGRHSFRGLGWEPQNASPSLTNKHREPFKMANRTEGQFLVLSGPHKNSPGPLSGPLRTHKLSIPLWPPQWPSAPWICLALSMAL